MFKVGDFVYTHWGFNGGCYGRIMSIDPKSTTPYEVKIYYYGTGQKKKDHNRFFTNDIRLAQDVIADEIKMYQNKIDRLIEMSKIETMKNSETGATDSERNALAMALYNLCVRNNINPQDFIKTMKDTRKNIRKKI